MAWTGSWREQKLYQTSLHLPQPSYPLSHRIGSSDLTLGNIHPDTNITARTVTDNLFHQGKIRKNQVAVSFELEPTGSIPTINGELTFGGTDRSKYVGGLSYW